MHEINGLVSISIPFYNSERFLSEAIESVLAQTYPHWELFLVDDGSSDRSIDIAHNYAARLPEKIRYLQHPEHRNCGLTCSRNLGARNSCGEFLAFLDSDDVWLPHKLEVQTSLMASHPEAGLVYGPSVYWYDWGVDAIPHKTNHFPQLAPGGRMYFPPSLFIRCEPFGSNGAPCPSSFLFRRSAFDHVGGSAEAFNPDTYQLFEDKAILTKVYLSVPVFVSDCCLDRYRCHPNSMWHRLRGTSREDFERRFYFRWVKQYLLEQGITDPEIWKPVRKRAWMYWLPLPASVSRFLWRINNRLLR